MEGEVVWDPPSTGIPRDATRAADPVVPESEWISRRSWWGREYPPDEAYTREQFMEGAQDEVPGQYSGALEWMSLNGRERRERLINPNGGAFDSSYLTVDYGERDDFANRLGPDIVDMALERGWGGCVWEFYGGFLRWLHYHGSAAICHGGTVKLEVWAHPYNWTDDNTAAARDLAQTVDRAYAQAQADWAGQPDYPVVKPVVITHSMGGLVGRAYAKQFGGAGAAHAIIHGAMPTHGAPAAYKRMHKGFEGAAALVLGWNGEEVTAVLANAPGGLQLLPNQFHKTVDGGLQWLFTQEMNHALATLSNERALPAANPYAEIYLNQTDWWRLINAEWVNPGHVGGFDLFSDQLQLAEEFHAQLGEYFHPNTTMFYSDDHTCWDRVEITGTVDAVYPDTPVEYENTHIARPSAEGDATVHIGSGLFVPNLVESVRQHVESGADMNFTHESAFAGHVARAQVAFWLNEMVKEQLGQ